MARTDLRELARLANVAGDMRAGRFYENKRKEAENLLSDLADKAKKAASGDYKGEKVVETAKFLSNFFGPVGKVVSMGLSALDAYKDKKHAADKVAKFKKLVSNLPKGLYGDYLSQNFDALLSQVEQSQRASSTQSLISNLTSLGLKSGAMDKFSPVVQDTIKEIVPGLKWGGEKIPKNLLKDILPKSAKSTDGLGQLFQGNQFEKALAEGWELGGKPNWMQAAIGKNILGGSPSLFDYYQFLSPKAIKMIRGKQEATVPTAPYLRRPSLRRRIR